MGDISPGIMLKEILYFSLFVALAIGNSSSSSEESDESNESMEMDEKSDGLCMAPEEVIGWCTAGTDLGDKLRDAMMSCTNMEEAAGRKKKSKKCKNKNKGKGKKCPTVEEAEAWFMEEHAGELCVFYQLGWLDEAGNFNNVTAEADLAPLPSNVTEAVSQENMEQCMGMVLQEMSEDKMIKKCLEGDKYPEEALNKLEELAKGTAAIKCFVNMFQDGCNAFVGEKIYQGLYSSIDTVVAG